MAEGLVAEITDCGDFGIHIGRDGVWWHQGSPIGRIELVKLFASALRREPDGTYWLVTPAERGRVTVEDAPFLAVELDAEGTGHEQRLIFRTNLDDIVAAGEEHPLRVETDVSGHPAPYIMIRPGLEARLTRPVFYALVDFAIEEEIGGQNVFGVWSDSKFFSLGNPHDPS